MTVSSKILQILQKNTDLRINDLVEKSGASRQMVHRALKSLIETGNIIKIGTAPKTFYRLQEEKIAVRQDSLNLDEKQFLDDHFLLITETGIKMSGIDAFQYWCQRQKLPFDKTVREFIQTRKKYLGYFLPGGVISGLEKIKGTKGFQEIGLDEVFYLDFYAIERFGKTRLGTLLHFAKQGQNKNLMDEIILSIQARVDKIIVDNEIDAVGYIPPTIRRDIQFMKVLRKKLNLPLPHIDLIKVRGEITIPQKALAKIEDRIRNAQFSIMVQEQRNFRKVLLIDDAVGSGATLNETAIKLKIKRNAKIVIGLAVTGSFKGFEVIQEI